VVDVATGKVLNKTSTGVGDTGTPSGFARITAVSKNPSTDPKVTYVYGGDNQGKMWRFDFTAGGSPQLLQMGDAGVKQPVTARPEVTMCRVPASAANPSGAATAVIYGTGRLLDIGDIGNTDVQTVYVLKDSGTAIGAAQWRNDSNMAHRKLSKTDKGTGFVYNMSGPAGDLATQAGWYFDLDQNVGERVNLEPKVASGTINIVSNIPTSSSDCSVGGSSNIYQLDVCTGAQVVVDSAVGQTAGQTLSSNAAAVGFIIVQLPDGRRKVIATLADGRMPGIDNPPPLNAEAHRAGWRRVRE
jgi:type IV pilus assembly protein PilY1